MDLYKLVSTYGVVEGDLWNYIKLSIEPLYCKKNRFLLHELNKPQHCWMLISGFLRSYSIIDGRERTERLFKPGDIIIPPRLIVSSLPPVNIVACTDAEVAAFSVSRVKDIYQYKEADAIIRRILEKEYALIQQHILVLQAINTSRKYLLLEQFFSEVINAFPAAYVASFAGMSLRSIARMRRGR